jgi:hypothetical protein
MTSTPTRPSFASFWKAAAPSWPPHREQQRFIAAVDAGQHGEYLLHWSKKCAKSTTAALRALHYLVAEVRDPDDRLIGIVANDEEQARVIFGICKQIVERSPFLRERIRTLRNELTFEEPAVDARTGGSFTRSHRLRVIARDTKGTHGELWSCICRDEIWAEPSAEMSEALVLSPARGYGEILYTTYSTLASLRKPGAVLNDLLQRVAEQDPSLFYSYIGGSADQASWNVCSWITPRWVEQQRKIFSASPSRFKRIILNEQVLADGGDTLLTASELQDAIEASLPAVPTANGGHRYVGGLDLGVSVDHAALVIGHLNERGAFVVDVCQVWKPTSGHAISFTTIVDAILGWHRVLPLKALNVDMWNAKLLVEQLLRATIPARLVSVEQAKLDAIITTLKASFTKRAVKIAPTQGYLLEQLESLRTLETRTPRRDLLKFAPSGTGLEASQHDDAAVALGLAMTDKGLVARLGRPQMPAIDRCRAADKIGATLLQIGGCPLIEPAPTHEGCGKCAPYVAAAARRDEIVQQTGDYPELRQVAAEWQTCEFLTQHGAERYLTLM